MAIKVANYISNLGKSVAYATVDKFAKIAPTTADLVQTNSELFKDITHNIINYKTTYKKGLSLLKTSKIYEAADTGITSVFEDLQTGRLWNKDRIDKITNKNLGFGDSDGFNDIDFDSEDDGFGSFDSGKGSTTSGDLMISDVISVASEQSAQMISSTIARTAKYTSDSQKTGTNMLYTQNMHAYNLFNNNLSAINDNISKVLSFSSTVLQTHAENSKKYFEESNKLMLEQTSLLRQIADNLVPKKTEQKESNRISYEDVMGKGIPDIKMYMKNVKKNFGNSMGSLTSMNSMMGDDSNMLEMFMASPLQFVPTYIVNKMIPKSLDKSIKNFDNSLKGFFGSIIAKINGMKSSDNMILNKIGEIFGISNAAKSTIETKNYEKGKVDWDGKSRKSLIEVIPGYLSKILAVLSGKSERLYDYDEGKFVDSESVKKSFEDSKKRYKNDASSDVLTKIDGYMKYLTFNTVDEQKKLREDMDKILSSIYDKGGFFDVNSKNTTDHIDYGVDAKSMAIFKTMFKNMDKPTQLGLGANVVEQRDRQTKDMKSKENSADSILQSLFNGFNSGEFLDKKGDGTTTTSGGLGSSSLLKTLDKKGNNIFYYLQNMYKELTAIRQNGLGSSSSSKSKILYGDSEYTMPTSSNGITLADNRRIKPETDKRQKAERDQERFKRDQERQLSKDKTVINVSDIDDETKLSKKLHSKIELENIKKGFKDQASEKKGLIDKLLEADSITDKTKTVIDKLNEITAKPMKFVMNTINKVDQRMYDLVFGSTKYKGQDVNGIFGIMKLELASQFGQLNLFINEKILNPIKQKLDIKSMGDLSKKVFGMFGLDPDEIKKNMHDYLFAKDTGLFSAIMKATKDVFANAFQVSKNSLKTVYGPLVDKFRSKKSKTKVNMENSLDELDVKAKDGTIPKTENKVADTISKLVDKQQNVNEGVFEYSKHEYGKGLKNLANLDDSEQGLLENIFNSFANKPMELDSLKFNTLMNLTKDLSQKDGSYSKLYSKLGKYNILFNLRTSI